MSKAKAPAAKTQIFIPLKKIDEENRLVYGTMTQEILDRSGEVMDYATSKPNFETWSNGISEASGGLSKGNVRVMHGLVAAGKLTDIQFNDESQLIEVCAKIVDDAEWNKCLEGVYTGLSVGGAYGKKWTEDGVKKYTAVPHEVSLVDNPCVPTATFQLHKADGSEQAIMFKVAEQQAIETMQAEDAKRTAPVETQGELPLPTNEQVVQKATTIATEANDGTTWMDHVTTARDELMKAATNGVAEKATEQGGDPKPNEEKKDEVPAAEATETGEADPQNDKTGDAAADDAKPDAAGTDKVTDPGLVQKWVTPTGEAFVKKAEAEAFMKAAAEDENDPAVKLKKALQRAAGAIEEAEQAAVEPTVLTDLDRLHKAFVELDQPRESSGAPKLEKGMYTVRRFADLLGDAASLTRTIKAEGVLEGDGVDENVASAVKGTLTTLGDNFITYAKQQVTELLAGIDTDVSVASCYDYYYRAAEADPENRLAKDCADLIDAVKDEVPVVAEQLTKAWGGELQTVAGGDPDLQKAFDALQGRYDTLEKVATDAVDQVEGLVKRVKIIEDTPLPRAPTGHIVEKTEGGLFKNAGTHEDKLAVVQQLLAEHGADGLATMMIKASQASGGHQLNLKG